MRGAGVVWAGVLRLGENKVSSFGVHGVFKLVRRVRRAVRLGVEVVIVEVVIVVMAVLFVVTALGVVLALLALEKLNLGSKQVDVLMVRQRLNQIY
jgi:hypothetical protein